MGIISVKQSIAMVAILALVLSLGNIAYTSQIVSQMRTTQYQYEELLDNHSRLQEAYENQAVESQQRYTGNPFGTELWPGQIQSENITGMHWYSWNGTGFQNCTDNILGLNGIVQIYDYVGTDVVHCHDAEVSEPGGAYLKKKEIEVGWLFGKDKVKVAFDLKSGHDGVPVYAQLYVNDVVKGIQQSESGLSYVTKTETLSDLLDLDKIGLYLHGTPAMNLAVCDTGTDEITVLSGIIDEIVEVFATEGPIPEGLAFDGTNLISCDLNDHRIYIHDGISGSILTSFFYPETWPSGLTVAGPNLVFSDRKEPAHKIWIVNKVTGAIIDSFDSPSTYPSGLAFDGANLISCDLDSNKIYVHSGVTSTVSRSFASPSGYVSGLAFDGVNLISCDIMTDKIYVHDGVTSSILRSYVFGGGMNGLTTFYYPAAAAGYVKNLRIIGEIVPMTEKAGVFKNVL